MTRFIRSMIVIFALCSVVLATSCGYTVYDEGINNFSDNNSNISITAHLMPGHDQFIDMFEYIDADYFYHDTEVAPGYRHVERVIVYFEYDPSVYEEAKEYCQENMVLSDNNTFEYNGYVFTENVEDVNSDPSKFPRSFKMFVYNDSSCTLLFMGFHCSIEVKDEVEKAIKDGWGAFLEEYYGEYYSFE